MHRDATSSDAPVSSDARASFDAESSPDVSEVDAGQVCTLGPEDTAAACSDGCSNDGDRFVDCDDRDCCGAIQGCPQSSFCGRLTDAGTVSCLPGPEDNVAACSDGCSNDGDRFSDCDDFDCCGLVSCGAGTACFGRDGGVPTTPDAGMTSAIRCHAAIQPTAPAGTPESVYHHVFTGHGHYTLRLVFTVNDPSGLDALDAGYAEVELRLRPGQANYTEHFSAQGFVQGGTGGFISTTFGVLEVQVNIVSLGSAVGACQGRLTGLVRGRGGPFAHPYDFEMPFDVTTDLRSDELFNPSCMPAGVVYTTGVDCCSGFISFDPSSGQSTCG